MNNSVTLQKPNRHKKNAVKLLILGVITVAAIVCYLLINSHPEKTKLFLYILGLRLPTLLCMVIASLSIGVATLIFQSIVNNRIVTPALLGMQSIYSFLHTAAVFVFGTGSILFVNQNVSFAVDLVLMGTVATFLYWYLFQKTGHNILYIMLIGTVLSSFFGSIQSAMVRVMDPNEYDALLSSLVADFNNVNGEIIIFSVAALAVLAIVLHKELKLLDVITMGRDQAINLGVDYDKAIRKLLFGVVLCMAVATATVGPVSFLGLIVANLSRQILKTYKHSHLIIGASLIGMIALIGGQLVSQHIFHFTVPVSTFVTIAGGVYFLYLLLRKKGAY
ncbi:MAG: iron chelate uptake ABC transporter family permease subunit [Clostridia bacterium]|nr:iron chelate uptake ABC transporter family permease subunit [Clostridia bacterium]